MSKLKTRFGHKLDSKTLNYKTKLKRNKLSIAYIYNMYKDLQMN